MDGTDASPVASTKDELFQVDYVEQVNDTKATGENFLRPIINPYPQQTPAHILGRPIVVLEEAFGNTMVHEDFVQKWNTHYAFILKYFRLFRCDFKLQFVIRSSGTQYGCGLVSWMRGQAYAGLESKTGADARLRRTSADSYLVDFSSSDALEIYVPYLFHKPYINREISLELASYMTFFTDLVFLNNISTGTDSRVDLLVYMSAHNIDVGGYRNDAAAASVNPGVLVNAHSTARTLNSLANPSGSFAQQATTALGTAGALFKVGQKLYSDYMNNGAGDFIDPQKLMNIIHEPAEAMNTVAGFESIMEKAEELALGEEGLAQQNSAQGVKIAMYGNMNQITKNRQIPELSETCLQTPMFPRSMHKLADVAMCPVVVSYTSFNTKGQAAVLSLTQLGWIQAVTEHFRLARMTYRVGLHFICHPLAAGRFQVQVFPTNAAVYTPATNSTDVPTFNFLVKGSDSKMFDIPFHNDTFALDTQDRYGNLRVTMLEKPTQFTNGVDLVIGMLITVSAGNDAQFFSVRNLPGKDLAAPTQVVNAHSLRRMHSVPAEIAVGVGCAPKVPYLPEVTTVEELAQRWSARIAAAAFVQSRYGPLPIAHRYGVDKTGSANQAIYGCKYDTIADWFYMTRSSIDIRVELVPTEGENTAYATMTDGVEIQSVGSRNAQDPANGGTYTKESQMPVLEYRAPFISVWNASSAGFISKVAQVNTNADKFVGTEPNSFKQNVYARAGEDVRFDHLNILPPSYFRPKS